ncbi:MAG: pyrroline-5-carboxylate reductase [Ignavibacteriae bacterium]|nr:MAG: pyrroline-5-carboxylate reductase [Ignavibacteriota bacterium]
MQTKGKSVAQKHDEHHHINKPIAILGAGNMGSALLKGIINAKLTPPNKIIACDVNTEKLQTLSAEWKVRTTPDIRKAVQESEILLLCVKPQTLSKVLKVMKESIRPGHLVISIVAGMRISFIQQMLGTDLGIVRTMPNIAATVDEGAAAVAFGMSVTAEQQKIATSIFEAVGEVVVVTEDQLDAVTGLSGSGPAYIYMVIEALIDGGVKMGLSRDISTKLAIQTVLGSATLAKSSGLHPAILRDQVTTPGGTTINAIHELESHGLRSMLIDAVATATRRSEELSKLMNNL